MTNAPHCVASTPYATLGGLRHQVRNTVMTQDGRLALTGAQDRSVGVWASQMIPNPGRHHTCARRQRHQVRARCMAASALHLTQLAECLLVDH